MDCPANLTGAPCRGAIIQSGRMRQDGVVRERNCEFMLELLITLARLFRENDKELYMVGGTVRDLLLRHPTSPDIDLATNARPDEIKRLIAQTHPDAVVTVGEQFGTVRVHYRRAIEPEDAVAHQDVSPVPAALFAEVSGDFDVVEITTYRSDQYTDGSRKPE